MKNLLSFTILLLLAGCATNTHDRGDAASRSLQNAAAEVQIEGRQLTVTMNSLESLVNRPGVDLRPQFDKFRANLNHLEASAKRNDKAAEQAAMRHAAYLASWDQQITNMNYEVVKTSSEARRTEVFDNFNAVNRRYAEARSAMQPLLAYLNDIRRALDADLTAAGLDSIKPIVANAAQNTRKVHDAMGRLSHELAKSGARMSPVVAQTAPPSVGVTTR